VTPEYLASLAAVGIHEKDHNGNPNPWYFIMTNMGRILDPEDAARLCLDIRNAVAAGTREGRRVEWGRAVAVRVACQVVTFAAGILVGVAL